ncbi:unnamed protein product [Rhizoctonia solani]|uniref:Transmembrane protein n=1 Tax=Rhizoctonia solani TaxID=456999 RepID=A0A8H2WQR1_9AGAM|nr:unnamed protein product [Rhizoctonia solani]
MPESKDTSKKDRGCIGFIVPVLWFLVCLFTLGFPAKYRERLRLFEDLVCLDHEPWALRPSFSDRGDPLSDKSEPGSLKTMRQKQQEEWDRLNIAMSVITATSAAALAIEATSDRTHIYWLVTAFYSIAFGLSLEGVILITYMTISAGGSSDEAITRLARGVLVSTEYQMVKPTAFIMALPAIVATYSSISLLLGLVTMVVAGPGQGVDMQNMAYIRVTMIPVGMGFLLLCIAIVLCEIGNWTEIWGRRRRRARFSRGDDGRINVNEIYPHSSSCCPKLRATTPPPQLSDRTDSSFTKRSDYSDPETVTTK